jgi:hypothetical protein
MKLDEPTIQALSASLRCINPALMKPGDAQQTSQRLWYQGNEPYFDITIEATGEDITWFQITLRGRVLSWRKGQSQLQTGETDELDVPPDVAYYAASKTIRDGANVDWDLVTTLQAILEKRDNDPHLQQLSQFLASHLSQRG